MTQQILCIVRAVGAVEDGHQARNDGRNSSVNGKCQHGHGLGALWHGVVYVALAMAKCELPRSYVAPSVQLLVDAEAPDTTQAAAAALASAAKELPGTVGESLAQAISAYGVRV
eukprot:scaffold49852_cov22-Tisochrysis_lutea.AAC.1